MPVDAIIGSPRNVQQASPGEGASAQAARAAAKRAEDAAGVAEGAITGIGEAVITVTVLAEQVDADATAVEVARGQVAENAADVAEAAPLVLAAAIAVETQSDLASAGANTASQQAIIAQGSAAAAAASVPATADRTSGRRLSDTASWTFVRSTPHWGFGPDGVLVETVVNAIAWDFDAATLSPHGAAFAPTRTNLIINPRFEGATNGVIGSGGVLPANFILQSALPTGISLEVVGSGTQASDGQYYVDLRWFGTSAGVGFVNPIAQMAVSTFAAGEVISFAMGYALVAGSLANFTGYQTRVNALAGSSTVTVPAPTSTVQRLPKQVTCTGSTSASVVGVEFLFAMQAGAINATFRFVMPNLQRGPYLSQIVLPTAGAPAASTRQQPLADIPVAQLGTRWNRRQGTIIIDVNSQPGPFTSALDAEWLGLISWGDKTANERMGLVLNPAHTLLEARVTAGGVVQTAASATIASPPAAGVTFRAAVSWNLDAVSAGNGYLQVSVNGVSGAKVALTAIPKAGWLMPGRYATTHPGAIRFSGIENRPVALFDTALDAVTGSAVPGGTTVTIDAATDARITQSTLTSGELIGSRFVPAVTASNGAALIAPNGRSVGFTIPAGSTGRSSLISAYLGGLTPDEVVRLTGVTLRMTVVYNATANFLAHKPPTTGAVAVTRSSGNATAGTVVSTTQAGTVLTRVCDYTVTATDTDIGVQYQVLSSGTIDTDAHSLQPVSITFVPMVTDPVNTAANAMSAQYAASLRQLGLGSVWDDLLPAVTAAAGAVALANSDGMLVGVTIPTGQTGAGSFIAHRYLVSDQLRTFLNGKTVRVRWGVTTSAGFSKTLTPAGSVRLSSGSASTRAAKIRRYSTNAAQTRRVIEFSWVWAGDEYALSPSLSQVGGVAATADETWQITDYALDILAADGDVISLDDLQALARRYNAPPLLNVGLIDEATTDSPQVSGQVSLRAGTTDGLDFPATVTTGIAIIQKRWASSNYDLASLAGRWLRFTWTFDCSANFARTAIIGSSVILTNGTNNTRAIFVRKNVRISASRYQITWIQAAVGDEASFTPTVSFAVRPDIAVAEWFQHSSLTAKIVGGSGDVLRLEEENLRAALNSAANLANKKSFPFLDLSAVRNDYARQVNVRADGTGDFTDLTLALASIRDAGPNKRARVLIGPGVYDVSELQMKTWVDLEGTDLRACTLRLFGPASVLNTEITQVSTIRMNKHAALRNLTILAKNCRYAIHADSLDANIQILIENCYVEHYGRQEVIDYRVAHGATPEAAVLGLWDGTRAWGAGGLSGTKQVLRNTTFVSPVSPVAWHDNNGLPIGANFLMEGCRLVNTGLYRDFGDEPGETFQISPIGARLGETIDLKNNSHSGHIRCATIFTSGVGMDVSANPWRDVHVVGVGVDVPVLHTPRASTTIRALRIDSASTGSSSSVQIGASTGRDALFGQAETAVHIAGGGGLSAGYLGFWDVGTPGLLLGVRLGNCTTVNKALLVTIDGGSPITVTFSANHTAQSNETVLGIINAALGAAGAASLDQPYSRHRIDMPDRQRSYVNGSAVGIPAGAATALAADGTIRLMTQADLAWQFAGAAIERMAPGERGRVDFKGPLWITQDLLRSDAVTVAFGDTLGVGPVDGRFVVGATVPLYRAYTANEVRRIA